MEQKTERLYPSAPLMRSDQDLGKRREKNINNINNFTNSISNIKKLITYFKDKNHNSKKKFEKHRTISTVLKSFDTVVIIVQHRVVLRSSHGTWFDGNTDIKF